MSIRSLIGFFVLSGALTVTLFHEAVLGHSILAPVDLAPTFFSQYSFVDPDSTGVPENHYILDQLTYDLPLQWTIYHAYRNFEIPWWDPYTYGGRPLLADAHVNGTDPVRLICYLAVPDFVLAYNLTALVKSVLCGLGMFALLSFLRIPVLTAAGVGLAYQFSGAFAFFFGHPWIQGSFVYFPFLWIVLISLARRLEGIRTASVQFQFLKTLANWEIATGSLLVACIFYSGNLQSHTYLVLFLLAWFLGEWIARKAFPLFAGIGAAAMSLLGVMMAAPVLLGQIEFYLLSVRPVAGNMSLRDCLLHGLLPLSAFFPWICGTFRTFDIGKIVELPGAGFQIYIGSILFFLAVGGIFSKTVRREHRPQWMTCTFIILGFFAICFTPLISVFYTRLAPLSVMAACVLAALALTWIPCIPRRRAGVAVAALGFLVFIGVNIGAHVLYPSFKGKIQEMVEQKASEGSPVPAAPALRQAQLDRFPSEVGWENPETSLAAAGIIAIGCWLAWPPIRNRRAFLAGLLVLNLLPLLLFTSRYIPSQPRVFFSRLVAGGAAQQRLIDEAVGGKRVFEADSGTRDAVFPNAMAHFYRVHVVHGYSALQPISLFRWPQKFAPPPREFVADIFNGESIRREANLTQTVRFVDDQTHKPAASISRESLNQVQLENFSASTLIRTDTWFPGWSVGKSAPGVQLTPIPPSFAKITISTPPNLAKITLNYVPRFLPIGLACASAGFALACLSFLSGLLVDRQARARQ